MKKFFYTFLVQLIIVGMALNIRSDVSVEKQLVGCMILALVYPLSELLGGISDKED